MRSLVIVSALSLAALSPAVAQPATPSIQLAPHRAIYDLSLLRSQGVRGGSTRREAASRWISAVTPATDIR